MGLILDISGPNFGIPKNTNNCHRSRHAKAVEYRSELIGSPDHIEELYHTSLLCDSSDYVTIGTKRTDNSGLALRAAKHIFFVLFFSLYFSLRSLQH
jgi:hypothetical protein